MIRDRDGLSDSQVSMLEANGRIRCLKRRHIENYFLDPTILFDVAKHLYITSQREEITIDSLEIKIKEFASQSVGYNLYQIIKENISLNYSMLIN